MLKWFKQKIRELKCDHNIELERWHHVHMLDYEPVSIEAKYKCQKCDKVAYLHIFGQEAEDWEKVMGDYKRSDIYEHGNSIETDIRDTY